MVDYKQSQIDIANGITEDVKELLSMGWFDRAIVTIQNVTGRMPTDFNLFTRGI